MIDSANQPRTKQELVRLACYQFANWLETGDHLLSGLDCAERKKLVKPINFKTAQEIAALREVARSYD